MTKKTTIFILNGFFSVLCSLLMYPLAKKEGNFLLMYPLFVFPYLRTLRAVFSETMCFYAHPRQGPAETWRLLMHPTVTSTPPSALAGFESLARRFPKICGRFCSFDFLFKLALKTAIFGRSLAQSILATLLLYPFGVKGGPKRRFLSDVPFGQFCLVTYPSGLWAPGASWAVFWAPGASWIGFWALVAVWGLLGWTLASSGFLGWILASKVLLGWTHASVSLLGLIRVSCSSWKGSVFLGGDQ